MLTSRNHGLATMAVMAAAMGIASSNGSATVSRQGANPGYRMGRRSRPSYECDYPGAKLAKKAARGKLTINAIR